MIEDAKLLGLYARDRSEEAFAEFVRRHLNLVYSVALRRTDGDVHLAQDVAQTVFTSVARKAAGLSRHAVVTAWLFTSTRYAAAAAVRGKLRRKRHEKEAQNMHEFLADSAEHTDWERLRPLLDDLLEDLNPRDREAVLLRFYDERSYSEIGSKLRVSDDAARMRVDRALDRLSSLLERRGVRSTAAALALALANQAVAAPIALAASITGAAMLSAATSVSPGIALLQFMGTTKASTGLAVLALATVATLTTREVRAHRDTENALVAASRDYDVINTSLQSMQQRADTADQKVSAALAAVDTIQAEAAPESMEVKSRKAKGGVVIDPVEAGKAFLQRHPEVKQALVARSHAHIASQYGRFYEAWGLTPEKIQQFEALLMETEGFGTPADNAEGMMLLAPGTGMSSEEVDRRVRALFGETTYWQYREAKNLAPIRQNVMDLASSLHSTDTPLGQEQIQRLNQVIAEARKMPLPSALRWASALVKAKAVLGPEQNAVLDDLLRKKDFNQALSDAMRQKAPPSPSPVKS